MKKTLLIVTLATAVVGSTYAQGLVSFGNGSASKFSTNAVVGGAASGVTATAANQSFYYALFYSATATTVNGSAGAVIPSGTSTGTYVNSDANWTYGGLTGTNTSAGRFFSASPNPDLSSTITGVAGGAVANLVLLGWSGNIATTLAGLETWLAANPAGGTGPNQYIGESTVAVGVVAGNGGGIPTPAIFGTAANTMNPLLLGEVPTVPEPGTLALAALGASSLLMLRRKK